MLKKGGLYALQALLQLALAPQVWRSSTDLATALELPAPMLEQQLLGLRRAGLLESRRGRRGGFRLALPTEEIPLAAILAAVSADPSEDPASLELPKASDRVAAALEQRLRRAMERELGRLTLAELLFDLRSAEASIGEEQGLLLG
ncbi:Rrf2 family transcriptional regulator [Synechococcus sp. CCY9201]|uniref:Rrf2 family transcriptional regulator n=1 Tax=Synechococcus sp. CCY9201 TaxID=174697 RepID=UPI002B20744B|nr:Rrf2 family transcriptional regulator [Synechococcus sp. CCY9201]MEA5473873.1 Rrf2 family transcriptional regulator [Synechococcus sp. CCY9201]